MGSKLILICIFYFLFGLGVTRMSFLLQSGVKSAVLEKNQKPQSKNAVFKKGHDQKLFGPLFSVTACFSESGTTFGMDG
jgi:hypothetical protein